MSWHQSMLSENELTFKHYVASSGDAQRPRPRSVRSIILIFFYKLEDVSFHTNKLTCICHVNPDNPSRVTGQIRLG